MLKIESVFAPAVAARANKVFEGVTDGTLLVLKGHLLLEESLYKLVSAKFPNPEYLDRANLKYYQLLNLARALTSTPRPNDVRDALEEGMWDAMDALNTMRNRLAHNLEPDLEPLLARMYMDREVKKPASLSDPNVLHGVASTIAFLLGRIEGFSLIGSLLAASPGCAETGEGQG
jgi:hypothetical protein